MPQEIVMILGIRMAKVSRRDAELVRKANDIGDKLAAKLMLKGKANRRILLPTPEEMRGLHLLDCDGEL